MLFPVSGVEIFPLLPPLMTFILAFVCSTAGVTGAFLLLPLQISVLGFTSPSVTATNHFYNIFAGAGGAYHYAREGRLVKPLALLIVVGTVPGIVLGIFLRVYFLPDPEIFKIFAGFVLMALGLHLWIQTVRQRDELATKNEASPLSGRPSTVEKGTIDDTFIDAMDSAPAIRGCVEATAVGIRVDRFDLRMLDYNYAGVKHNVRSTAVVGFSLAVGVIGGAYGIGGGAFIAAFLVGVRGLSIYTTAGATLLGTLVSSLTGVIGFWLLGSLRATSGLAVSPDPLLGLFFGVGGLVGTYCGARVQKYIPQRLIKSLLAVLLLAIGVKYIWGLIA